MDASAGESDNPQSARLDAHRDTRCPRSTAVGPKEEVDREEVDIDRPDRSSYRSATGSPQQGLGRRSRAPISGRRSRATQHGGIPR